MMNEKDIRDSGLLEQYLLGELTISEEKLVIEAMQKYPELKSYHRQLEADLERMSMENAISPPDDVKQRLMAPAVEDQTSVIPISNNKIKSYLRIAAALVVLLGISSYWLYIQVDKLQEGIVNVENENSELKNQLELVENDLAETKNWYKTINDPKAEKYILAGNQLLPEATAISYVNHETKTVILNASGLPPLTQDKDYQLWADVEGEMIDMGLIPKNSEMIAMTYIENAESLNITIEPAGGNDHPTVEQLISNVYLN